MYDGIFWEQLNKCEKNDFLLIRLFFVAEIVAFHRKLYCKKPLIAICELSQKWLAKQKNLISTPAMLM